MKRSAKALIGKRVRSHFRAPWIGTVLSESDTPGCVWVRVELDRCGRPMRKPERKHLNIQWLELLP